MSNRSEGNRFEQEFAQTLYNAGFWVHVMQQNRSGQPADIIAVKGRFHTLIDCKVISDERGFPFERIEENQKYSMKLFQRRCGELCYFALKLTDGSVWMLSLERMLTMKERGQKRITEEQIRNGRAWSAEEWIRTASEWGKDI